MTEFKLPELGENIESGDVVRVTVAPGEKVSEGQSVLELETDKAVIEVPSSVSGTVSEVKVKQGQKLRVGEVIFTLSGDGNGTGAATTPAKSAPAPAKLTPAKAAPAEAAPPPPSPAKPAVPAAPVSAPAGQLEFRVPELGENIETGDVVRVIVEPGQSVAEGQPVLELETDKAVIEVPATVSGTVSEVKVKQGDKVKVGDVVFTLTAAAGAPPRGAVHAPEDYSSTSLARDAFQSARAVEGKTEESALPPDMPPELEMETIPPQLIKDAGHEQRPPVAASPAVRRLAREIGVDIYDVKGSGPGGRVSEGDVKAHAKGLLAGGAAAARAAAGHLVEPELPDFSKWGAVEKVSLRAVRRKTAEHLAEAWNVVPHVTHNDKANVTVLEELRKRFAHTVEMGGGKMTMTAIALKVAASALKNFPQFNASLDMRRDEIIYKRYVNIGVAVDTDRGLLVPVIRDVDQKNITELAVELASLSAKARERKLTLEEMQGGTFTITNLGGIGGTAFSPIVNYPEVAILGMSRARMEPVWLKDKFEPRLMLPLSLSYDHRIIDGADAARFVRWIVEALEQPFVLSVQG